ncbi:MAG: hypothetical protein E7077_04280 [Bacteroidales bacterium]|jgi:hypothetical protein|nr:hypothetical protein [Bacteroidales bacterium]MBP5703723.1 hypothetical protein [Paludibacteraceae bacterium]
MKRLTTIFAVILAGLTVNAEVPTESFTRVMNPVYAKKYSESPIQVDAVFYKLGLPKFYRIPPFMKEGYCIFQCTRIDGKESELNTLNGEAYGEVFLIEESRKAEIEALTKGTRLTFTGKTKLYANPLAFGQEEVYFIVESIAPINK